MIEESTVTSKGQVTIPKDIRDSLGIKAGKKVVFILQNNEAVIMPKADNPFKRLSELRKKIVIKQPDIDKMIKESKREWSQIE